MTESRRAPSPRLSDRRRFLFACATLPFASGLLGACRRDPAAGGTVTPAREPAAMPSELGTPKPLRLLVLGGTGFIGPHIVDAAQAKGWEITLFNRGKSHPELFPDVEKLVGDRDGKLDALVGRKWDAVVDTSGYVPRIVKASASLLADNVEQYVFISSISAYAKFDVANIDETAPVATMPDPENERVQEFYGALKALCEQAVEQIMPGRVTNVRPGYIVGPLDPTDRFTYWPVRIAQGGEVAAPGTTVDPVQFIDARDLAAWIVGAIEQRHVGVYNLVGPERRTGAGELLQTCIEVSKSDATITWLDPAFLEAQKVELGGDLPILVPPMGEYLGFAQVSNARALATGLRCRPMAETVADTLKWFSTLPEPRRKTLRAGWLPAREAEVLAAFHEAGRKPSTKPATKPAKKKAA
ncbi:MAG: NAD-dependent epimerase/dehydratase family protein [Nannocystaceae bacterium]